MFYRLLAVICKLYFNLFHRIKVIGTENVPMTGAVVFCPNHIHNFDPPAVAAAIFPKRKIAFMAKAELFEKKWIASLLYKVNAFPVKRGGSDRQALKIAMEVLRANNALGIFPEGTRSKDGELSVGSPGAAMLALKHKVPIIPVAISGSYRWFRPLTVRFGPPVKLDHYEREKISTDDAKEAIALVMKDIQSLLAN